MTENLCKIKKRSFISVRKEKKGKVKPVFEVNFDFKNRNGDLIKAIVLQQREQMTQMEAGGWTIAQIDDLQALWRTIIGLGNNSVYEVSMTLHHTYGIPYVPSTLLKGVVRSWIIRRCFKRSEKKALENPLFKHLFGETDQKGAVVWWDAFPQNPPRLRPDVLNVNYPEYYESAQAPGDYQPARPVYFLTLDRKDAENNTLQFHYYFGLPPGTKNSMLEEFGEAAHPFIKIKSLHLQSTLLDAIRVWTRRALYLHGLGGKTSRGYGRQKPKQ